MKESENYALKVAVVIVFLIGLAVYILFAPKAAAECIIASLEKAKTDTSAKLLSNACHREHPQKK